MSSGGWWWPGFLIELAIFLTLLMAFTWWLTNWLLRRSDSQFEERWDEHIKEHWREDHNGPVN